MDLPEFVEDTRDRTFHKDISTEGLFGLLRHSHGYHQFVHFEEVIAPDRAQVTGNPETILRGGCGQIGYGAGQGGGHAVAEVG